VARFVVTLVLVSGCAASQPTRLVRVTSPLAQTISLLGDTLYGLTRSGEGGPQRAKNMADARDALSRDSSSLENRLRFARTTAEMGYLRDAVSLYARLATTWYFDPRVFRERGELLFRLRQFGAALVDFRKAGLLLIGRSAILELGSVGTLNENTPLSTTQFQVFFLQGVVLYCQGDYSAAAPVLLEAVRQAETTEDRSRALLWLFFAVRRFNQGPQAAGVLDLMKPEWAELTDVPELRLLFAIKGLLPTDSIRARALGSRGEESQLLSYGLAYALLLDPERKPDAELWLLRAHTGDWDTLPYVVAEAELARLRGPQKVIIR
jgi:tetratricopeptide (TPR) repeat protein